MHPITEALLRWYDQHARKMPWRGIQDPYGIWVSEIMLQQTRVETVRDYYVRFMKRFPTLRDLADAPEEDVLKMWEGLGYYSRARNLQAGARQVLREYGGHLPSDPDRLKSIKGIGPYTSCSIASIAFGVPVPAVDGNVIRVISRLYCLEGNPAEADCRREIERLAAELVPENRAGDHNQAMMDLGATVCVPGTPDCAVCPLQALCQARARGIAEELPRLPKARPPKEIQYDLSIIYDGGQVLMYRRGEKLLQGLWCFPLTEGWKSPAELTAALHRKLKLPAEYASFVQEARHIFTHQVWKMRIHILRVPAGTAAPEGFCWIPLSSLPSLALPTAVSAAKQVCGRLLTQGDGN